MTILKMVITKIKYKFENPITYSFHFLDVNLKEHIEQSINSSKVKLANNILSLIILKYTDKRKICHLSY